MQQVFLLNSLTSYVSHSDAPALSTDADTIALGAALAGTTIADSSAAAPEATPTAPSATNGGDGARPTATPGGEWDDEALAASFARKGAATTAGTTAELLDMKAFDAKRRGDDDIAERMRIEETKAQLAAAKEGMAREALRLKEERENKDFKEVKRAVPSARGGGGLGGMMGGSWVPPHMRAGGTGMERGRMGSATGFQSSKLDTEDENLFPDLAAADAIVEKQKNKVAAYKVVKKTAVGGGATWGSRPPVVIRPKAPAPAPEPEPKVPEPEPVVEAPAPAAAPVVVKKVVKKKKKDLSTFKAS